MQNIKLNALPVYNDKYRKTKIRAYSDKLCANFGGLNVQKDDVELESFIIITINSLLAYQSNYYLQVYLGNYAYKIVDKQLIDYFDNHFLSPMKISFLILRNGSLNVVL